MGSQRDAYSGTLQSSATAKSGPVFAATTPAVQAAYSALACFRTGMSGSASFRRAQKSLRQAHPAQQVGVAGVGANPVPERVYC